MNRLHYAFRVLMFSVSLLAGCATPIVEEGESTVAAAQEVVAVEAIRFTALALDTAVTERIDAKSPAYVVDGSPRRFAAFALPTDPSRRYIDFASIPFGGLMIYELKTLVPIFTFLDAGRKIVRTIASESMEGITLPFEATRFEGRVAVPPDARYVLVHGTESAPGSLIVHGSPGHTASIPGSRFGVLRVTLSNVAKATIRDSGVREDSNRARLFYVASVDGVSVQNAAGASQRASSGRGFQLTTVFPARLVAAKPLKVVVVGTHATGAPVHAIASRMAGNFWSVEAELDFTPEADKVYVVRGNLDKQDSTVWIEDAATGQPVTKKGSSRDRLRDR